MIVCVITYHQCAMNMMTDIIQQIIKMNVTMQTTLHLQSLNSEWQVPLLSRHHHTDQTVDPRRRLSRLTS